MAGCHDRNAPCTFSVLAVMVATIRREAAFPHTGGTNPPGALGATRFRDIGAAPASAAPPWMARARRGASDQDHVSVLRSLVARDAANAISKLL